MTRFARARGSKSSNERLPEEPTSWQVMKRQLEEAQQQQRQEGIPIKYIHKKESKYEDNQEWAEFGRQVTKTKQKEMEVGRERNVYSKKSSKDRNKDEGNNEEKIDQIQEKKIRKKQEMTLHGKKGNSDYESEINTGGKIEEIQEKKKQKKRKVALQDNEGIQTHGEGKKKRKKIKKDETKQEIMQEHCEEDLQKHSKFSNVNEPSNHEKNSQGVSNLKKNRNEFNFSKHHQKNGKIHKRRKPDEGNQTMFINGQEITIIRFDGFPVKKEDYVRLKELRQKLIAKGIPHEEIKQVMKLERRKAEKALAREKKKVCFHCRKPGHNLSECPELGDDQNQNTQSTGICFKCGSTEHTHYQCRVNRSEGFQFAKCFICNEQGHIARHCPDNPRGLYPKGGSCRVCGDVTHLKKDCPDLVKEKQDQTMTVETLKSDALEALDEDLKGQQPKTFPTKKKKHIKF